MEKRFVFGKDSHKRQRITVPLKGEVCEQYVRCGKDNCRCATGILHGPYYYRVYRENGTVHKVYVRRRDLSSVRASVAEYHRLELLLKEMRSKRVNLTRSIRSSLRSVALLIKSCEQLDLIH